jgi:hypothetical protein
MAIKKPDKGLLVELDDRKAAATRLMRTAQVPAIALIW